MDEHGDGRMPQGPTNNIFFVVGGFGLLAALIGAVVIVSGSLGYLH